MKFLDTYDLTPDASQMLERLRRLAIEYQVICQQAPNIWDADTPEDAKVAKMGCNGQVKTLKGEKRIPPCPIKNLCLETAIATQSFHGVWGGLAAQERRNLRRPKA